MNQILKDGEAFRDCEIVKWDRDAVIEDGQVMRVPLTTFFDSAKPGTQPAPTFDASHMRPRQGVQSSIDQARSMASRQKYVDRISDAWRKQPPAPQQRDNVGLAGLHLAKPETAEASAAYDRMRERLENRWRNPKPLL